MATVQLFCFEQIYYPATFSIAIYSYAINR